MSLTQEQKKQFFATKEGEPHVIRNVGNVKFSNFPKDVQKEMLDRLVEKDPIMALGQKGILPGIKIDGKEVTRDNIKDFEKKVETNVILKPDEKKVEDKKELEKKKYSEKELLKLNKSEQVKILNEFGVLKIPTIEKDRIKQIIKLQEEK